MAFNVPCGQGAWAAAAVDGQRARGPRSAAQPPVGAVWLHGSVWDGPALPACGIGADVLNCDPATLPRCPRPAQRPASFPFGLPAAAAAASDCSCVSACAVRGKAMRAPPFFAFDTRAAGKATLGELGSKNSNGGRKPRRRTKTKRNTGKGLQSAADPPVQQQPQPRQRQQAGGQAGGPRPATLSCR